MIFDDEKRRKKDAEDFERIVKEMEKIIEDAFKNTSELTSFAKGASLKIDERKIFDTPLQPELEDIVETSSHLYVTIDIPHASEKTLKIRLKHDILEVKDGDMIKDIKLPVKVKRKYTKSFKNGILDIQFEKN